MGTHGCAALAGLGLGISSSSAEAAAPTSAAQRAAMQRAVPAAVMKLFPRGGRAFAACFRLREARRSTRVGAFRMGFVSFRQGRGACAVSDASYSFWAYWRATPKGLRLMGNMNQGVCLRSMPVPLAVQREVFPRCPVY